MTDAMCQTTGALLKSVLMLGELLDIFMDFLFLGFFAVSKKKSGAEKVKKNLYISSLLCRLLFCLYGIRFQKERGESPEKTDGLSNLNMGLNFATQPPDPF
jgi:hypothetical protein